MWLRRGLAIALLGGVISMVHVASVAACGGLFCQNDPVDQAGERIVFTVNGDTVTSLIEIQYSGSADDFSWILPIPEAIGVDDVAVPDDGQEVFDALHAATDVRFIAPPVPECAEEVLMAASDDAGAAESDSVEVFASGEVGPFGFDVIGSSDPTALIGWLQDHDYRVEPSMEPLIDVYVEEQFAFIAMRLLDGETSESIAPIEITYPGSEPMIPLRLTAVAAFDDMPIWTWVVADEQAVPANYAHMVIETAEVTFFPFGGNNYQSLLGGRADAWEGRAFITEFAGPLENAEVDHSYFDHPSRAGRYLTRLAAVISPHEMTIDPLFTTEPGRADVSNVRDASELRGLYSCQRDEFAGVSFAAASDAIDPTAESGRVAAVTPAAAPGAATRDDSDDASAVLVVLGVLAAGVGGAIVLLLIRRTGASAAN